MAGCSRQWTGHRRTVRHIKGRSCCTREKRIWSVKWTWKRTRSGVTETDVDYYTQPLKEVDLSIIEILETRMVQGARCAFGDVEVTEQYTGYKIKRKDTIIGMEPLDLPPITFRTKAFWVIPAPDTEQRVVHSNLDLAGGLHGAEHAIIALMPLHVMCDRWDIGGLSSPAFGENCEPAVFVYDGYEGGSDLQRKHTRFFLTFFQVHTNWYVTAGAMRDARPAFTRPNAGMTTSRSIRRPRCWFSGPVHLNGKKRMSRIVR